jgi:hypothetical protein
MFFFAGGGTAVLKFAVRASHLLGKRSTTCHSTSSFFLIGFFQDRISWTVCLGWLWTLLLLISASWVSRITGMSHQCLTAIGILTSPPPPGDFDLQLYFYRFWMVASHKTALWSQYPLTSLASVFYAHLAVGKIFSVFLFFCISLAVYI